MVRIEVANEDVEENAKTQTVNPGRNDKNAKKDSRGNGEENSENFDISTRSAGKSKETSSGKKSIKGSLETGSPCSLMANQGRKMAN
ncbi:hypothetical protein JTB14_009957 [Gonioctena quinquepunctata]|nr:hypothetical protein JTB14_009957 [Gonioctena quinquepunctata]